MRVAVQHTDPEHPNSGVAAYRFGRVEDFTHPLTSEVTKADDIMVALLDQARAEFPESAGYKVRPERFEDDGTEDCYLCLAAGTVGQHRLEDNPELVPVETNADGEQVSPWSERDVTEDDVPHVTCPNCKGEKRTPKGAWRPIDEDALRQRAAGEPVEVPTVKQLAEQPGSTVIHKDATAAQTTETTQED